MTPYRIAIVGTGGSVSNHLEAIAALEGRVELVAAVDIGKERVRAVAGQHPLNFTQRQRNAGCPKARSGQYCHAAVHA